jgi:hypothetical protein
VFMPLWVGRRWGLGRSGLHLPGPKRQKSRGMSLAEGSMPGTMRCWGEWNVPAERMTSFFGREGEGDASVEIDTPNALAEVERSLVATVW